ncbi:SgcJ/EcaC family oxidoreductase [Kitasatospora paranensis]|uniref:YybH family protein n=1 Tax=Kitasatospora paranensis TaxID=258053 RepID=A0ABW2GBE2_9ACTN
MTTTAVHEGIVREVMDDWRAAVDNHEPERVAARFTPDAIFQGLHPYTVGREGIAEYYASQPLGMKAQYTVLETRQVADGTVLAYLGVDFTFTDRPTRNVWLSVLLTRTPSDWAISHYQVSKLD